MRVNIGFGQMRDTEIFGWEVKPCMYLQHGYIPTRVALDGAPFKASERLCLAWWARTAVELFGFYLEAHEPHAWGWATTQDFCLAGTSGW